MSKIPIPRKRGRPRFKWMAIFYPKFNKETMQYDVEPFIEFGDPEILALRMFGGKRSTFYISEKIVLSRCKGTEAEEIEKLQKEIENSIREAKS